MTVEGLKKIIGTSKTEKTIVTKLEKKGIKFINNSEEMKTLSIKILTDNGMIRVYKNSRKELIYQTWSNVQYKKVIKRIPTCHGHSELIETYEIIE